MKDGWYYFNGDEFLEFISANDRGCDRTYKVPTDCICVAHIDKVRRVYHHIGNGEYRQISDANSIQELEISDVIKTQMLLFG